LPRRGTPRPPATATEIKTGGDRTTTLDVSAGKPQILCVDDEPQVLESLRDSLRRRFDVVATGNGFEALKLLATGDFPVVVSDMRMPLLDGARFMTLARDHAPDTVRVILSGQSTMDDALSAVNDGQVFRYLIKPCSTDTLIVTLETAVRHRELMRAAAAEVAGAVDGAISGLLRMLAQVEPGALTRADRVRQHASELAATVDGFKGGADVERAAELSQLGVLSLDEETRHDLERGSPLRGDASAAVEEVPNESAELLAGIPRLEGPRTLLAHQSRAFEPTREGYAGTPMGARILRIALDFELLQGRGVPSAAALEQMRRRERRYDAALLDRFGDLLGHC
jgi:CheY-like chemotaxis protein